MKDMESKGSFKIRVKSGENEIEIQYPLTQRSVVVYNTDSSLGHAVKALSDIIKEINKLEKP